MTYKLWQVVVQDLKKPYSFTKVKLLEEINQETADKIYETSMKHPHIGENIIWMRVKDENKYNVTARTYCYLEGYQW